MCVCAYEWDRFYLTIPTKFHKFQIHKSQIVSQCNCILPSNDLSQDWKHNDTLLNYLIIINNLIQVSENAVKGPYSPTAWNISRFGKSKRLCDVRTHMREIQLTEAAGVSRGSNRDGARRKISISI